MCNPLNPTLAPQSNVDFLRTCVLFTEGGEYDAEEVESAKTRLRELEDAMDEDKSSRMQTIDGLKEAHAVGEAQFSGFKQAYDEALKELSMREVSNILGMCAAANSACHDRGSARNTAHHVVKRRSESDQL